ncbi:MAG: diguanylate cyclase [Ruminococcus sp.]|nr:diguanylate cyclase [Ruminococcus sp.]
MKKRVLPFTIILMMILSCLVVPASVVCADEAEDVVLLSSDFEDQSMTGWSPFGGRGNLSVTNETAHSGEYSLKITDRSSTFHSPSVTADSFMETKQTYNFNTWIYHEGTTATKMFWTMRCIDSMGTANYISVAEALVEPKQWTPLSAVVETPEDSVSFLLYYDCENTTLDFCIDDISITGKKSTVVSEDENNDYLYRFDFENGNETWRPRGDNRLIRTDEYSHTGSHSIYVTNRTRTWNGPTVNINKVERGVNYFYSAYVMYNDENLNDSHKMRMEVEYNIDGQAVYQLITEKEIKKGYWTEISGMYTLPENAIDVMFYIQTANITDGSVLSDTDLMPFYVDTVTVTETSVVHRKTAMKLFAVLIAGSLLSLGIYGIFTLIITRQKKKKTALASISIDAMTKALNRNSYEKRIELLEKEPEQCKSLYFSLFDVNFLKYINDHHGHEKGDEAITRCAELLIKAAGSVGDVYRTGGDEFVCITTKPLSSQIKDAIKKESAIDKGYPFAVAAGFSAYDPKLDSDTPDVKAIIERCDKEMYSDKQKIKEKNKDFSRK